MLRHFAKYDQEDMHCECIMYANQIKYPLFHNYMHHSYIDYKVILYIRSFGQIKHTKDMHLKCINIIQKITTWITNKNKICSFNTITLFCFCFLFFFIIFFYFLFFFVICSSIVSCVPYISLDLPCLAAPSVFSYVY